MKLIGWFGRFVVVLTALALASEASAADATATPIQRPRAMASAMSGPAAAPRAALPATAAAPAGDEITEPPQPTPLAAAPARAATAPSSLPAPRATGSSEIGLRRTATKPPRKFSHDGFITDLRVGTVGCVRGLCSGHNVRPGFRLDGFLGGNIRGFVDFGLAGGWGSLGSDIATGTNVLALYGLDAALLQQALGVLGGQALPVDLTALSVTDSKLRTAQAGPLLRVHFIPRGRFAAYVGSGVQYNLFRARYSTAAGDARIDFHGLAVPIEAGFGVHVHEHVAVGLQFDYLWTWYALANLDQGGQSITVPLRILDEAARMQNTSLRGQLPQFWTFGLMLRARV